MRAAVRAVRPVGELLGRLVGRLIGRSPSMRMVKGVPGEVVSAEAAVGVAR